MRVAIVLTPPLDPTTGGVQMSTVKMSRMLMAKGHEVAAYSFAGFGHAENLLVPLEHALEGGGTGNAHNLDRLRHWLQSFNPDVVVNQMPYDHAITDVLAQDNNARTIACLRNSLFSVRNNLDNLADSVLPSRLATLAKSAVGRAALLQLHKRRHARDLRTILRAYDRFVMFAEPNIDELRYFVPDFDAKKIAMIPNSIPSVAKSVPAKEKRILWLARVDHRQKRADLILPIWRRLAPLLDDWSFDVVGDGPMLGELRRRAAAEELPRIAFHGRRKSQPFFERSAIFIMTSDFEGFPNTLIEAQGQGTVPVAFDTYPMVRWLIDHSDNGMLVPRHDVAGLADAVAHLAKDPIGLRGMAERALEAAESFTEDRVGPQWDSLLKEVARE